MKINKKSLGLILLTCLVPVVLTGCTEDVSTESIQQNLQEKTTKQAAVSVGMPNIINFTEKRLAKKIYELRDDKIVTYTYLFSEQTGKKVFFCKSIGYALPYATQYSNPEKRVNTGTSDYNYNIAQAEPNGLYMPSSAEGTWVNCIDGAGTPQPVYVEPRVIVSPFKLGAE